MSLAFRQFRAYLRLGLILIVLFLVAIVLFMNRNHRVTVWFFRSFEDINVVYLLVVTAAGSIAAAWICSKSLQVVREVKRVRQEAAAQHQIAEQRRMTKELDEREKRIDAKLAASVRQEQAEPPAAEK
jgi:hypothetical protein